MASNHAAWKTCGESLIQFQSISGSEAVFYRFIFSVCFWIPLHAHKWSDILEAPQSNRSLGHRIVHFLEKLEVNGDVPSLETLEA